MPCSYAELEESPHKEQEIMCGYPNERRYERQVYLKFLVAKTTYIIILQRKPALQATSMCVEMNTCRMIPCTLS